MQTFLYFSCIRPPTVCCIFYTKSTAQARPPPPPPPKKKKLVVFLHPSAESGRLSSDSLSPEFRSLALLYVHADHFINGCTYGRRIGLMSCELSLCIYVACVTEGHMVE